MTEKCKTRPPQNHCWATWGLAKRICFSTSSNPYFVEKVEIWNGVSVPAPAREVSGLPLCCRENDRRDTTTTLSQVQLLQQTIRPAVVGEVTDQVTTSTIETTQKTQLQPPFSPQVESLCHPWFTTSQLSYRFPVLKIPPPPSPVLLVSNVYSVYYTMLTWHECSET